jgi:outer membrane protein assembly factor BamD (BamD/ComL family)
MNMFSNTQLKHLYIGALACFAAAGCSSTNETRTAPVEQAYSLGQRIDNSCSQQVNQREQAVRTSASPAHFMALANQANRCIDNIRFFPTHPDNELGMQLNAIAVVNYVKSGHLEMAQASLDEFRQRFAQQDLVFDDYTSFIDTATALLDSKLSNRQLAMLNINPTLRSELQRARQWSLQ